MFKQHSGSKNCGSVAIANALIYCGYRLTKRDLRRIERRNGDKDKPIKGVKRPVFCETLEKEMKHCSVRHGYIRSKRHFVKIALNVTRRPDLGMIMAYHTRKGGHVALFLGIDMYREKFLIVNSQGRTFCEEPIRYIDNLLDRGSVDYWIFWR